MKTLAPTLSGRSPAVRLDGILQLLEAQGASGTLRVGEAWIRLRGGRLVRASGDAVDVLGAIVEADGEFSFRAARGEPNGDLDLSVTALLLEVARRADEGARV